MKPIIDVLTELAELTGHEAIQEALRGAKVDGERYKEFAHHLARTSLGKLMELKRESEVGAEIGTYATTPSADDTAKYNRLVSDLCHLTGASAVIPLRS